jgi:hypothetical protein
VVSEKGVGELTVPAGCRTPELPAHPAAEVAQEQRRNREFLRARGL